VRLFTTTPTDVVGAIHPKAMPMILTTEEERETWLTAPWNDARKLHGPLPDGMLEIVHRTPLKVLPGVEGIPSGDPLRWRRSSRWRWISRCGRRRRTGGRECVAIKPRPHGWAFVFQIWPASLPETPGAVSESTR
jgi:hypothetical protein